jgi:2-dehydro-3-deoxy-D-arabinonate dehydratase
MHLVRIDAELYIGRDGAYQQITDGLSLDALLALPLSEIRTLLSRTGPAIDFHDPVFQAPIQSQEVWAAGVTYQRSREARSEEAVDADPYARVYDADRPEIFFKATPSRVRGPGDKVAIRSDSDWNVPEPELAVVCNSRMEVVGYTIGNDMSSRSIEGENPLYLPQAKLYDGACALGPAIALAWDFDPTQCNIELEIVRQDKVAFSAASSTSAMRRTIPELLGYLGRHQHFDFGCILLTGTGVVPPSEFSLKPGDQVNIRIGGIGTLSNEVEQPVR